MGDINQPKRIVLIDDFAPWRQSIAAILLRRAETEVVGEAADGLEAVQKVQELKPDLILLDVGLPGIDGLEVARRVKRLMLGTRIIFLSHCSEAEIVNAALSDGAEGYVLKTDAGNELLKAIAVVLSGEQYVSRRVSAF